MARLLDEMPVDGVNLAWLVERLERRSFGVLTLVLALLGLVPGIAMLVMVLLPFPAVQMILGREHPTLPRSLTARSIPNGKFARWTVRVIPMLKWMETFIQPRWPTPFQATKRLVGAVVLLLTMTLAVPFPFNIVPTLAILLISLAYLEEDGVLLALSLAFALFSFVATAGEILITLRTTGFVGRLWMTR